MNEEIVSYRQLAPELVATAPLVVETIVVADVTLPIVSTRELAPEVLVP